MLRSSKPKRHAMQQKPPGRLLKPRLLPSKRLQRLSRELMRRRCADSRRQLSRKLARKLRKPESARRWLRKLLVRLPSRRRKRRSKIGSTTCPWLRLPNICVNKMARRPLKLLNRRPVKMRRRLSARNSKMRKLAEPRKKKKSRQRLRQKPSKRQRRPVLLRKLSTR
jgi:hypothetical protein